ncbi:MAG: hypothetical protein HRU09_03590 [Oligoflexales bacterium]|nr:hypothetical protein [Oligoflexales bacterium]
MERTQVKEKLIRFNGLAIAISITRNLDPAFKSKALKALALQFPPLAKIAIECEFLYRDLPQLDAKSLTHALHSIQTSAWLSAWKLTDSELKRTLLNHMSKRRQDDFLQSARGLPPIPRASAIKAQSFIAKAILAGLRKGTYQLKKQR